MNTLLPGLPKTVDNAVPAGSVTAPASGAPRLRCARGRRERDGRRRPTRWSRGLRGAFEIRPSGAGPYSVFGTQTAPVAGSTYRQTLATGAFADSPADLRVVVTDVAGNEIDLGGEHRHDRQQRARRRARRSGRSRRSEREPERDLVGRHDRRHLPLRPVGDPGVGTAIGSGPRTPPSPPPGRPRRPGQPWELIAVATDGGGNVGTSTSRVVLVDRTQPTGGVTAPAPGASVGGSAVRLAATAADAGGSGVALVEWQVKEFGAGVFSTVASDAAAPYDGSWNSTAAPDEATEVKARVTDAASSVRITGVVAVTVDSTGPSVTLADPSAVLSGTVALGATGGGAVRVEFSASAANANTWTQIADDAVAPFGAPFDTAAFADNLDLRAVGFDGLGNASAASVREDVRPTTPSRSSSPQRPPTAPSRRPRIQIVLTASSP